MDKRPPIDRVREREQSGSDKQDTAREVFGQKEAKLQRTASEDAPVQETEEQFEERMGEKLKESDKDGESP